MKEFKIVITHIKILDTISNLNKRNLYPVAEGVCKIIAGIVDSETKDYLNEPTFGTLLSFNSKKTNRFLLALQRHGYVKKIYAPTKDCLVYTTTQLGEDVLEKYHKKHKKPYIKKEKKISQTIIKI